MTVRTTDTLVPPVTAQELADWLVISNTDPLIPGVLISATDATIRYIGYDLITREWELTHWDWPTTGTVSRPSVSRQDYYHDRLIKLPYSNLLSVEDVKLYGTSTTNFIAREDAIILTTPNVAIDSQQNNAEPAIFVQYKAGYGATAQDVPAPIRQAILMVAAYIYEHRGECAADMAVLKSGARDMLVPYINPSRLATV